MKDPQTKFKHHDQPSILIVAGEASGDILGGSLVTAIHQLNSECRFFGIGGRMMEAAGVERMFTVDDLGVTGFTEVVAKLGYVLSVMAQVTKTAKNRNPTLAILIDYPDFNLRLAKKLKKIDIPVVYYVSPQMWAWRSGRIELVRKYVDLMLVLFPFEQTWYQTRGAKALYVGHPVLDRIEDVPAKNYCRQKFSIQSSDFLIAMLPGSRKNEILRILPLFLKARTRFLNEKYGHTHSGKKLRFILPLAETISREKLSLIQDKFDPAIEIIQGDTLSVVRAADFAWVTSGTAALETALLGTPHVVVYRTSSLSYFLAKRLVKISYISVANLMMDECHSPELIQNDFTVENLLMETHRITDNDEIYCEHINKLKHLHDQFGSRGASDRAAKAVIHFLKDANAPFEALL